MLFKFSGGGATGSMELEGVTDVNQARRHISENTGIPAGDLVVDRVSAKGESKVVTMSETWDKLEQIQGLLIGTEDPVTWPAKIQTAKDYLQGNAAAKKSAEPKLVSLLTEQELAAANGDEAKAAENMAKKILAKSDEYMANQLELDGIKRRLPQAVSTAKSDDKAINAALADANRDADALIAKLH